MILPARMSLARTSAWATPPWQQTKNARLRPRHGAKGWLETSPTNRFAMADKAPQRGDIWIVQFGPSIDGEIQKIRPAVVSSNGTTNELLNRIQVVPVSSQVARPMSK